MSYMKDCYFDREQERYEQDFDAYIESLIAAEQTNKSRQPQDNTFSFSCMVNCDVPY